MLSNSKVTVIAPIWNYHPTIVSAMLCQKHSNWELLLIHDGPCSVGLDKYIRQINDPRITYIETEHRIGPEKFGHPLRDYALKQIAVGALAPDTNFVVITNADNYYMPGFLNKLLDEALIPQPFCAAAYCTNNVHNYIDWKIMPSRLELGHIDIGQMVIRKDVACAIGWPWVDHSSDWTFINEIRRKYGDAAIKRVEGCLFVHN